MDDLVNSLNTLRGKRILITGHTGFKGSWLALWLANSGAMVYGYSLEPSQENSHFKQLKLHEQIIHKTGDIRDYQQFKSFFDEANPEIVFHLAAQAIVKRSYKDPKETFDTNIGGSVNLLECVRNSKNVKAMVYITSDKCYVNKEWVWGYRENDELGGKDPYSVSKAAAELVFSSYCESYFKSSENNFGFASVRAGNVIGGGDWSEDRVVPDCMRSLFGKKDIIIRNPKATRPWQHVLEPLSGYIMLARALCEEPENFSGSWNFGPKSNDSKTVYDMAQTIVSKWGSGSISFDNSSDNNYEARILHLNCDKANLQLGWHPRWDFDKTIKNTVEWYKSFINDECIIEVSGAQINNYMENKID